VGVEDARYGERDRDDEKGDADADEVRAKDERREDELDADCSGW
jgi:hypothetical protein